MITDEQLTEFCTKVDELVIENFKGSQVNIDMHRPTTFMKGKKYVRIVVANTAQRWVYCFVDIETGNILKAAGWKAPAKGIRGNIKNGTDDVTPYGARYNR